MVPIVLVVEIRKVFGLGVDELQPFNVCHLPYLAFDLSREQQQINGNSVTRRIRGVLFDSLDLQGIHSSRCDRWSASELYVWDGDVGEGLTSDVPDRQVIGRRALQRCSRGS